MNIIELEEISKIYKGKDYEVHAVDDVSLTIEKGEMVAIMGTSGSGKTTLLNIMGLIDTPDTGRYYLEGKDVGNLKDKDIAKLRNRKLGFVIQDFALIDRYTAIENVMVPLQYSDYPRKEWKERALNMIEEMNVADKADRFPKELSGGQKQRIAIARALVNGADVILADEPTGSLDSSTTEEVMNIFKELNKFGVTIVIVTHDIKVALECTRVIKIEDGRIIGSYTGNDMNYI